MPKVLTNVKEDILKIARDTLINSGYDKISMRDIANQCGIATGTLYNYFKSKQEIIGCIISSDWDTMLRRLENSNKSDDESIIKLERIFNELTFFMNNTHNIWYENFIDTLDSMEICHVKDRRKILKNQLSKIIFGAIEEIKPVENVFLCNVLTTLFISFANDSNVCFQDLKPHVIKLLA